MTRPGLVVFDLDGTLVDSRRDLADAANALIAELGGEVLPLPRIVAMVGEGVRVLVERVLRAGCGLPAVGDEHVDRFRALYGERLLRTTRPYTGIPQLLEQLRPRCALAVLTNKPLQPARRILDGLHLLDRFEEVVGGDGPLPRKPDPAALLALAAAHGTGEALLVGDSSVDLRTARAAAMPFALAGWGFGGENLPADLLTPDDVVLDAPLQLLSRLHI